MKRFPPRIAGWALPFWLYVSVTGVVVYSMLYHINLEEYRVELEHVAALELTIIPNLSGGSYASLAQLRLAGSGE